MKSEEYKICKANFDVGAHDCVNEELRMKSEEYKICKANFDVGAGLAPPETKEN